MSKPTKRFRANAWYQVDGDISPESYGGTFAMEDSNGNVEVRQIQPTREYVGDEAREVGYPFWSREASYDRSDLNYIAHEPAILAYVGAKEGDFDPSTRAGRFALAVIGVDYGYSTDEGPSGWSRDVLDGIGRAACRRDFKVADREFRQWLKED